MLHTKSMGRILAWNAEVRQNCETVATVRHRLGVALLFDELVTAEIDGLRRALGDSSPERIPPHITLISPINIRHEYLEAALGVLRAAAVRVDGPLRLHLGRAASFLPANPVLYLEVAGDLEALAGVQRSLDDAPFARPRRGWPWIPHVTLADGASAERVLAGAELLDGYARDVVADRLVLLAQRTSELGTRWEPLADVVLGSAPVVGRGGLALELTTSRLVDPPTLDMLAGWWPSLASPAPLRENITRPPIVVTGRRDGQVVGVGRAWIDDDGGQVTVGVRPDCRRQGVGTHLLAHLESTAHAAGWTSRSLRAHGPADFYQARSAWSRVCD